MTNPVSMTSVGMQNAGYQFVQTYDILVQTMQDLRNKLTVLRTRWDGEAAKIFETTMTDWGVYFDDITYHLDEMADMLIGGAGHAQRAEDEAIQNGKFFPGKS